METIWLQRSSSEVPWGFRLQGGREFAQPLTVQKVTPGSVAGNVLVPGDILLKIGSNNVTNVTHNEGQDLIRYSGDLLQLTIKRCPRVAASAPVSPTPISSYNYPHSESPSSFRSLSPISDNYPMYQQGYPYQPRMYPDERESQRQFASLPRHATGYRNYDPYEQQQVRRDDYSTQTMPKPTPFRPNMGYQQPQQSYGQMRNDSENYGYNNQSYGRDQQYEPYQPDPYANRAPGQNFTPVPGYGIAPPTYGEAQQQRSGSNTSGPSYSRQGSQNMYQNQNPSYNDSPARPSNAGYYVNSNYNEPQSPYQRQDSGMRSYNGYDQQRLDDNQQRNYQTNDTSLQRQTSTGYQRQPSYDQTPPIQDGRQVTQVSRVTAFPRGLQQQNTPPSPPVREESRQNYQRQTSGGSFPDAPVYKAQISSSGNPSSEAYLAKTETNDNNQNFNRGQTKFVTPKKSTVPTGISSIEDILSPFEKFPQYYNEFVKQSNEPKQETDSGVASDFSEPPRGFGSPFSVSSDLRPSPTYQDSTSENQMYQPSTVYSPARDDYRQSPPAAAPPPPPPPPPPIQPAAAFAPPPPPPPPIPPPGSWSPPKRKIKVPSAEDEQANQQKVPDAVLNTMLKQQGSGQPKPFAYFTGGIDLKEFKKKNRPPPKVMPKNYKGPEVGDDNQPEVAYSKPKPVRQPQAGPYKHVQYNNPINVYSRDNAEDALRTQSQGAVTSVSGRRGRRCSESDTPQYNYVVPVRTIRMPDKKSADIEKSAVYKMIKESESSGKSDVPLCPVPDYSQKQGLSFLLLQTLYDETENGQRETTDKSAPRKKHQPRDPLLRHNSIDDEMTFSGLNKKTDIPSKAFHKLAQISNQDDDQTNGQHQNAYDRYREDDDDEGTVGKYEQGSIRYTGKHIPSPSFKVLQRLAKCEDDEQSAQSSPKQQTDDEDLPCDEDDGLPDTLSGDEVTDKRYTGGHIPSRSFRFLQMSVGEQDNQQNGSSQHSREATPPQKAPSGGRTLKIITRSTALKQPQDEEGAPTTDF